MSSRAGYIANNLGLGRIDRSIVSGGKHNSVLDNQSTEMTEGVGNHGGGDGLSNGQDAMQPQSRSKPNYKQMCLGFFYCCLQNG